MAALRESVERTKKQRKAPSKRKASYLATQKLSEYKRKRDPKKTPEPAAEPPVRAKRGRGEGARGNRDVPPARAEEPIFVVQRHDARRLHYDFRLEKDGT